MPKVFLSYRRSDTGGEAGRLADALQRKLGQMFVFRDVVSISPGDLFDVVLEKQLVAAKLVLVLIGPSWLDELKSRLAAEGIDYHHLEVATALRERKRVIPVLVRGAALPAPGELPEDLLALTKCQAMTLRDEAWKTDVDRLIDAIGRPYRWHLLAARLVIVSFAIILAVWLLAPKLFSDRGSDYDYLRGLVLSLAGLYGLIELVIGYRYFRKLKRLRKTM